MGTIDEEQLPTDDAERNDLKALARRVTACFFIGPRRDGVLSTYNETLRSFPSPYAEIGEAFQSNVRGLFSTVSIPFALANNAAIDRHYQRVETSERILSLLIEPESGETPKQLETKREAVAREKADSSMRLFLASAEGTEAVVGDCLTFLERSLRDSSVAEAAKELLLQGVVLCWGAFEVLARDSFVALLNHRPQLVGLLLKDPVSKRRFEVGRVSIETLATHGFDLSGKMGTLLGEQQDLSDIYSIKAVYEALCPTDEALRSAMSEPDLRVLSQRRNLIVHRRGIIDELYRKNSGCRQVAGERLKVEADELEKHVRTAIGGATAILHSVTSTSRSPGGAAG